MMVQLLYHHGFLFLAVGAGLSGFRCLFFLSFFCWSSAISLSMGNAFRPFRAFVFFCFSIAWATSIADTYGGAQGEKVVGGLRARLTPQHQQRREILEQYSFWRCNMFTTIPTSSILF